MEDNAICGICGEETAVERKDQRISVHCEVSEKAGFVFITISGSCGFDYCLDCLKKYGQKLAENLPETLPKDGQSVSLTKACSGEVEKAVADIDSME